MLQKTSESLLIPNVNLNLYSTHNAPSMCMEAETLFSELFLQICTLYILTREAVNCKIVHKYTQKTSNKVRKYVRGHVFLFKLVRECMEM